MSYGTLMGVPISNPFTISSSNITDNERNIRKLFSYGAAAVVTKTICPSHIEQVKVQRIQKYNNNLFNTTLYSKNTVDQWLYCIEKLVLDNKFIIPSIFDYDISKLSELARKFESVGVKALEIGLSCPNDQNFNFSFVNDITSEVCNKVKIPVAVKLSLAGDYLNLAKNAIRGGCSCITISDALPAITRATLNTYEMAAYSGPAIKPLVLGAIYKLRKAGIHCDIIGVGGVMSKEDIEDYLAVGANAVGLCSVFYIKGTQFVRTLISEYQ